MSEKSHLFRSVETRRAASHGMFSPYLLMYRPAFFHSSCRLLALVHGVCTRRRGTPRLYSRPVPNSFMTPYYMMVFFCRDAACRVSLHVAPYPPIYRPASFHPSCRPPAPVHGVCTRRRGTPRLYKGEMGVKRKDF